MTEEIDGYKDDLERQVATLRDGLDRVGRTKEDKKSNLIAGLESALADAKASYGSFNAAYRELDKAIQPRYQPVRAPFDTRNLTLHYLYMQIGVQFKKDLTEITESLKNEKNAHDRKELGLADDQRTTEEILDEAKRIQSQSKESTTRSKKIVQEITETGNATLEQLQSDRNKLEEVHNDLEEMDSDLKMAQNQLKGIARKLSKDNLIRGLCILACLIILVAIIVVIVKRKKAKGGSSTT